MYFKYSTIFNNCFIWNDGDFSVLKDNIIYILLKNKNDFDIQFKLFPWFQNMKFKIQTTNHIFLKRLIPFDLILIIIKISYFTRIKIRLILVRGVRPTKQLAKFVNPNNLNYL